MREQRWYEIKAKGQDEADVFIFGDIGESWWSEESVTANSFVADLAALGDVKALTVRINSYGGSVADGLAIYNALQRHPADVTTANDGVAMSIASLIFMAGARREMAANSLLMIHAPWGVASGNAQDMRAMAETLDKFADAMTDAYLASGLTRDEVQSLLKDGADHFYTADEALETGFATDKTRAQQAAASYRQNRFTARREPPQQPPKEKHPMADTGNQSAAPEQPAAAPADIQRIEAAAEARAVEKIKARNAEFDAVFSRTRQQYPGMTDFIARLRDDHALSVEAASAQFLTELGKQAEPLASTPRIEMGQTAHEKFGIAATAAIRARCGLEKRDPQNEWAGRKLIEMARASLEMKGVSCRGMLPLEIAQAALSWSGPRASGAGQTTSDFDVVLENTMHKELLAAWGNTPDTWSRICKTGSVGDLRAWNRLAPGSIGDIDAVNEAGEYLNKTIPDAVKESITARRRGNIIAVTPEVLINDDLSYFSDVPAMFGRAARRTIETAFYSLLTSAAGAGPTLNETGAALFSATHGNLTTSGAAPTVSTIDAGRQILAAQRDPSGNEYLGVTPAIWLGPLSLGGAARVVNGSQYDPDTNNNLQRYNIAFGIFRDVVDTPRLSGTAWYMFADPAIFPVFEVVFLDGQTEPMLTQETEFRTSGLAWKVELPFGVGCIGWRGAYQNDGA